MKKNRSNLFDLNFLFGFAISALNDTFRNFKKVIHIMKVEIMKKSELNRFKFKYATEYYVL